MTYCANCGHPNPPGSNFCSQCGTALDRPAEQTRAGPDRTEPQQTGDITQTMSAMSEDREAAEGLGPEDEAAVQALPAGSSLLIVLRGANAGSRFLLDRESTAAGRRSEADIVLDDVSVSRKHAVFNRTGQGVVVKDVGSLNGTYVNRQLVEEQLLRFGDEVQIGKFRLVFYDARS